MRRSTGSSFADIRGRMIRWFGSNGRSFRWRRESYPYLVLVAELLLKQTTAKVVDRFLPRFLRRYPNMRALAKAERRQLQSLLRPLGLSHQRSKQLRALARTVMRSYGGRIPSQASELMNLPGVGPYTANALICTAHGKPVPIVDTNVARVLMRLCSLKPSKAEARRSPEVWMAAAKYLGRSRQARVLNWALLDLAALICLPRNPRCNECPLRMDCDYAADRRITFHITLPEAPS
jgi:A/G-specific adenine glycosylase